MKFSVRWTPAAENELTKLWMDTADRRAVTVAANEIDVRLQISPADEGESRQFGRRILLVQPLGVTFEVHQDERIVRILDVWQFVKPGE